MDLVDKTLIALVPVEPIPAFRFVSSSDLRNIALALFFVHAPARARSDSIHAMAGQNMDKGDTPKSQHRGRGRTPLRSFRPKNKKIEGKKEDEGLGKVWQMPLARHSEPCLGLHGLNIHEPARWIRQKSGRICLWF